MHKQTGELLDTTNGSEGAKWIFVMSTSKKLYAGKVSVNMNWDEIWISCGRIETGTNMVSLTFRKRKGCFIIPVSLLEVLL